MWLHQYHPKTLACNLKTFAKVGCLKDLLEILCRIVNSGTPILQGHADFRDRVELKRINLILGRRIKKLAQRTNKTMTCKGRIKQFMRRKILTRRKQNMKAVKDWTKTKKEKASYLRMENRKMMVKKAFEKRMKAVKDKMNAKKEKATKRKEKRNMMAIKAIEWYNSDPKYRFLYDRISDLFAELLKADLEHLNTGRTEKISMASKWCPSLYSSYDYSTLICGSVARRLFPYDSCPEYKGINESHYVYRVRNRLQKEVLVPLRKALELPEIYMSANQWNLLQYDRISSVALKTYKRAFINMTVKVAERQWKRMLDTFSKNGKFVNRISTFNMNDCMHGFCCGFTLMTSELCANPWKGKLLRYGDNPEIVSIEGDDLGSRINFCRLNNVVSPKGDDNDTKVELVILCGCQKKKKTNKQTENADAGKLSAQTGTKQWRLRLISFLDKILETAIDLNVSKQDMIKRVFVFDGTGLDFRKIWQYEGCCSSCVCGSSSNYEAMREKFKRNGYVMPETVHWDVSNYGSPVPAVLSVEDGLTHISRPLETSFRGFLEGDGTLNLRAMMESEICSAGDPELLVLD
uniref:Uncharacterized protein n=1 Tax=Quercus lobata TaxID=97700 RepID=A0A7N2R1V3_QUELO